MGFIDEINSYRDPNVVQQEEAEEKQNSPLNTMLRTGFDMIMQMQTARETSMMVNLNSNENTKREHVADDITSKRERADRIKAGANKVDPDYVRRKAENLSSKMDEGTQYDSEYEA